MNKPIKLGLLTLLALNAGCAATSNQSPDATPVLVQRQMQLPPLPESARQKPAPSECLPSCLDVNNAEQQRSLEKLMNLAPLD